MLVSYAFWFIDLEESRLLEKGAYFKVDTQRCGTYLRPGFY